MPLENSPISNNLIFYLFLTISTQITNLSAQLLTDLLGAGAGLDPVCGRTRFSENSGEIKSPSYPNNYPNDLKCEYHIEIQAKEQITFKFLDLDVEDAGGGECYDFLTIIAPNGASSGQICGTSRDDYIITADMDGEVLLEFFTDESENKPGFRISYQKAIADPCIPNPCFHGATCTSVLGQARCICTEGWEGDFCEIDIDECENRNPPVCDETSQICVNTPGSYLCEAKSYATINFDIESMFVDSNTGNPCVLSDNGRDLLKTWMEEYRQWRLLLQDYAIKYDEWKNDECPGA